MTIEMINEKFGRMCRGLLKIFTTASAPITP